MVDWLRFSTGAGSHRARRGASWRCAGLATLALIGFVGINVLSGCGGGGGGGGSTGVIFPNSVSATFQILNQAGQVVAGGTVNLNSAALNANLTGTTDAAGSVTFSDVKPGTYAITVNGTASGTVTISGDSTQTYRIIQGQGVSGLVVQGRIRLNNGDLSTANCTISSVGVCAKVLVRVRDLNNLAEGRPIVTSITKPDQCSLARNQWGLFTVSIPKSGTYQLEVRQAPPESADDSTAPFSGKSASFRITGTNTVLTNIDICANPTGTDPGGTPPPPPATPVTPTPTATSSATATPTATSAPTATPTATTDPNATPTATTQVTPTNTPLGS